MVAGGNAVIEPNELHRHAVLATDDYDPDEAIANINEIMAAADAQDPLLDSYQQHVKRSRPDLSPRIESPHAE
jgi:hypothetical protein